MKLFDFNCKDDYMKSLEGLSLEQLTNEYLALEEMYNGLLYNYEIFKSEFLTSVIRPCHEYLELDNQTNAKEVASVFFLEGVGIANQMDSYIEELDDLFDQQYTSKDTFTKEEILKYISDTIDEITSFEMDGNQGVLNKFVFLSNVLHNNNAIFAYRVSKEKLANETFLKSYENAPEVLFGKKLEDGSVDPINALQIYVKHLVEQIYIIESVI